jgi:hypothetical protein
MSSTSFLSVLHEEKLKHKEHRHQFVKQKLLFIIGLFGIGSLSEIAHFDFWVLLYFIPYVALAYDTYIFSEDFKVKRIGVYIRTQPTYEDSEDAKWEEWLSEKSERREKMALVASLLLTLIALFTSSYLLHSQPGANRFVYGWWLGASIALTLLVFLFAYDRRRRLLSDAPL